MNSLKKILAILLLITSGKVYATRYYLSNKGSNAASGLSPATAWATLDKVNSFRFNANDTILFKRGDAYYGTVIPGRNNLFFDAYGTGALPVITGFTTLKGWGSNGKGIWSAKAAGAGDELILVTINNQLQRLGRYPNAGDANGGYLTYTSVNANARSITDNKLTRNTDWTGAEIAVRKLHYIIDRCRVTSHAGGKLTYTNPGRTDNTYFGKPGYGYFFQDDIRTLDQFGEWFLNKKTNELSVYFGGGNPSAYIIKAATVDTLFNCGGYKGRPARSNISLRNIAFEGANKVAFFAWDGKNISVKNCVISNCNNGIFMWNIANSLSEYNTLSNMLTNGIVQEGRVSSPTAIRNNTVKNCGLFAGMSDSGDGKGIGIFTDGDNNSVEYNRVDSIGYNGIQFGGSNASVSYNYVSNFTLVKDDGGGIYTFHNITKVNRVIKSNIVIGAIGATTGTDKGSTADSRCIYLDGETSNVDVLDNTVSIASSAGIFLNNSVNVKVSGNTIYKVPTGISIQRFPNSQLLRNNTITNNIIYADKTNLFYWNSELNTPKTTGIQSDMKAIGSFDNNYYRNNISAPFDYFYHLSNGGKFVDPPPMNFSQWQSFMDDDKNSHLISDRTNVFVFNATTKPVVYPFKGLSKKDATGNVYNDRVILPPFSSKILFDNGKAPGTK